MSHWNETEEKISFHFPERGGVMLKDHSVLTDPGKTDKRFCICQSNAVQEIIDTPHQTQKHGKGKNLR